MVISLLWMKQSIFIINYKFIQNIFRLKCMESSRAIQLTSFCLDAFVEFCTMCRSVNGRLVSEKWISISSSVRPSVSGKIRYDTTILKIAWFKSRHILNDSINFHFKWQWFFMNITQLHRLHSRCQMCLVNLANIPNCRRI